MCGTSLFMQYGYGDKEVDKGLSFLQYRSSTILTSPNQVWHIPIKWIKCIVITMAKKITKSERFSNIAHQPDSQALKICIVFVLKSMDYL